MGGTENSSAVSGKGPEGAIPTGRAFGPQSGGLSGGGMTSIGVGGGFDPSVPAALPRPTAPAVGPAPGQPVRPASGLDPAPLPRPTFTSPSAPKPSAPKPPDPKPATAKAPAKTPSPTLSGVSPDRPTPIRTGPPEEAGTAAQIERIRAREATARKTAAQAEDVRRTRQTMQQAEEQARRKRLAAQTDQEEEARKRVDDQRRLARTAMQQAEARSATWSDADHAELRREAEGLRKTAAYDAYLQTYGRRALQTDGTKAAAELREIARLHRAMLPETERPDADRLDRQIETLIAQEVPNPTLAADQPEARFTGAEEESAMAPSFGPGPDAPGARRAEEDAWEERFYREQVEIADGILDSFAEETGVGVAVTEDNRVSLDFGDGAVLEGLEPGAAARLADNVLERPEDLEDLRAFAAGSLDPDTLRADLAELRGQERAYQDWAASRTGRKDRGGPPRPDAERLERLEALTAAVEAREAGASELEVQAILAGGYGPDPFADEKAIADFVLGSLPTLGTAQALYDLGVDGTALTRSVLDGDWEGARDAGLGVVLAMGGTLPGGRAAGQAFRRSVRKHWDMPYDQRRLSGLTDPPAPPSSVEENIAMGNRAIAEVLASGETNYAAMYRKDTGWIVFDPGDPSNIKAGGLAKLIAKHPEEFGKLSETIALGKFGHNIRHGGTRRSIILQNGRYRAVLRQERFEKRETWVLSHFYEVE